MSLFVFLLSGIFFSVTLILFRGTFFGLARNSLSLLNALLAEIEEEDKMKQVKDTLFVTLKWLVFFFVYLLAVACCAFIPILIYDYLEYPNILNASNFPPIIPFGIGSIIPFIPIGKSKQKYTEMSQLFHEIILDNYALGIRLFKFQTKKVADPNKTFVLVTGLARSGTTALTHLLSDRGPFASLKYANMPFLLAPKLWSYLPFRNKEKASERLHSDQVKISLNTSAALEEYFFKVFLNDGYIKDNSLLEHGIDPESYHQYMKYQQSIAKTKIYLAKNNNALLRFESLRKYNQSFHAIFMFRDPLSHASSLLKQHKRFIQLQNEDPFILKYMNWLCHHEFGNGHKFFSFETSDVVGNDPLEINYWLELWISYYTKLLSVDGFYVLMEYADFLKDPQTFIRTISERINIEIDWSNIPPFDKRITKDQKAYDPNILAKATEIYEQLKARKVFVS
ncbi:MAG: sulfotransferase domain-containing protein [Bacteroidota bacterium]